MAERDEEPACLDPAALADLLALQDDGEPDFVQHMALGYLARTPGVLAQLVAAATAGDSTTVAWLAHDIKGSSGNFGASRVVQACRALEQAARAGRVGELLPLSKRLSAEHNRLCRELERLCAP
jgi:HPt (histidine-containing phosphotransfer) domain-containing protein